MNYKKDPCWSESGGGNSNEGEEKQLHNLMKETMIKVATATASVKGTSQPRKAVIEGKRKKGKKGVNRVRRG